MVEATGVAVSECRGLTTGVVTKSSTTGAIVATGIAVTTGAALVTGVAVTTGAVVTATGVAVRSA